MNLFQNKESNAKIVCLLNEILASDLISNFQNLRSSPPLQQNRLQSTFHHGLAPSQRLGMAIPALTRSNPYWLGPADLTVAGPALTLATSRFDPV